MSLNLLSPTLGKPEEFIDYAREKGSARMDEVERFVREVYRLAPQAGLAAHIICLQSWHETADKPTALIPWVSYWWRERLNPAGIGITGDPAQNNASRVFPSGTVAAQAMVVHVALYVFDENLPAVLQPYIKEDPRWQAALDAGRGGVASDGDLRGFTGTWAVDDTYHLKIESKLSRITLSEPSPAEPEQPSMATHRYILSAGHRNTNRGGANNEINWTYPSVKAIKAAIEARGGKAWIVSENDGDNDPSFFVNGGLQAAASRCVQLASRFGPFDAYISSHYNGGASPGFHAIFPDSPTGGVDVKANNPLDVRLCRVMRDKVKATNTVRMLSWTADSPGVMSERETRVGADGNRLGEFYGTVGFREDTARVIIEASSIDVASERAFINDPNWVRNKYAEAIVDALETVFGKFSADQPQPEPTPTPTPAYPKPVARAWMTELRGGKAYADVEVGTADDGTPIIKRWYSTPGVEYRTIRETKRQQHAMRDDRVVGPPLEQDGAVIADAIGENHLGESFVVSSWNTVFYLDDLKPIVPPAGDLK